MKTNKILPDSSINKVWENFRKMNGIIIELLASNWVSQSNDTFINIVEYEGFTSDEILEVDLYDDGNLTETQISEYDGYITEFNVEDGKIVAVATIKPTQLIKILARGEIVGKMVVNDGGSSNVSALNVSCLDKDGKTSNVQKELDEQNNNLSNLGGFTPIIDDTGKITGYKTSVGGADTVFPFTKPSFLSSDWKSQITSGVSSTFIMNDSCAMMLQHSIPSVQANYITEMWSPYVDITNYNNLKLDILSRKKSQNQGEYYSPRIYLQNESGSISDRIYLHPQTSYDSAQTTTLNINLSSYVGKFRLYVIFGGWGSGDNFNNGACICIGQATLS